MKTYLFNPYTGKPRHPPDIASDPAGLLIAEPGEPLVAASPPPQSAQLIEPKASARAVPVADLPGMARIAAMEHALTALEHAQDGLNWYGDSYPEARDGSDDEAAELIAAAMEGLRAVLAYGVPAAGSGLMEGKDAVREHRELMLLAAADLESWMKSHGKDLATVDTVKRLRAAALSQGQQTEQGSRNGN